ncbi:ABC transporter permease [Mycetocola tolaasinivorans]|uniref:ABC transporter permease n=1 Tax=Mycetocola tolaasinivorans TaxID=76635 RepID=A0A3L7A1C4_9MICO|nr:ABC transporter permease [Mycetocola tolaasinivorans]RLP74083.1 ABC transporter permease [Mycetocola tolaasinivorans]
MTQTQYSLSSVRQDLRPRRVRLWGIPFGVALALAFALFLLVAAVAPQIVAWGDPFATDPAAAFSAPGAAHIFGTDHAGRDIYTRIVFGAQQSLLIGVAATAIGVGGGLILGLGSALAPRAVDLVVGRLIEVLFVFPTVLIALILISILGSGIGPLIVAVGLGTVADSARLIRAQALKVKHGEFVAASRALGRSSTAVLLQTIAPNVIRPIFVIATLGVGQAILWASSLSFLGLGAAPPSPEWGTMLADGRNYLQVAWWISLFPGLFITLSALSLTIIGRFLQQRTEGR